MNLLRGANFHETIGALLIFSAIRKLIRRLDIDDYHNDYDDYKD